MTVNGGKGDFPRSFIAAERSELAKSIAVYLINLSLDCAVTCLIIVIQ